MLFENTSGTYALWLTNGVRLTGGGNLGAPGGTWHYAGLGDFNGDGIQDILFTDGAERTMRTSLVVERGPRSSAAPISAIPAPWRDPGGTSP